MSIFALGSGSGFNQDSPLADLTMQCHDWRKLAAGEIQIELKLFIIVVIWILDTQMLETFKYQIFLCPLFKTWPDRTGIQQPDYY